MFLNHENTDFVCNLCPLDSKKVVKYPHVLERHMKQKHAIQLLFSSVHKYVRNKAAITMQDVTQYKCFECPAVLANYGSFKGHIDEIHNKEKDFACQLCNKLFIRNNYLMKHIRVVHEKVRNHKCNECARTFSFPAGLSEHIRTHHMREKLCVCEICGESFFSRDRLRSHKYSHGGSRFCCSSCGKSYKNPMILKLHIQETHTKPSKSICDICGSELKSERLLKAHLATVHTTERSFVCDICSASYKCKKHLTHHYKKHQRAL
uniref:PR domain zinc finger protein 5 n=1 Tax=Cacopsylla melanoneura TaxID=428564 RepID=A0A8D8TSE2_9HEMI